VETLWLFFAYLRRESQIETPIIKLKGLN